MKLAAGIMSGTSLDGIDVSIAKIKGINSDTTIEEVASKTYDWPTHMKNKIKKVMDPKTSNLELLTSINFELGQYFGKAVVELCNEIGIESSDLDFVSSHGQTIWHQPNSKDDLVSSTLQLGDGSVIAEIVKTTVISNFRTRDIAAGGQGAPLVPFVDEILFKTNDRTIALHNLGGISNTTILPKNKLKVKLAFDTGPANMMIDYAMAKLYKLNYDEDGKIARTGELIKGMYDQVLSMDYFKVSPPKTTGRETYGDHLTKRLIEKYDKYKKEDIIYTLTRITSDSIINAYKIVLKLYPDLEEIIFSGGGAHNKFLLEIISNELENIKITTTNEYNISVDYKEALAFIILGNQTLNKLPSNARYATGANKAVILGQINYY